jgi:hypothetical protein
MSPPFRSPSSVVTTRKTDSPSASVAPRLRRRRQVAYSCSRREADRSRMDRVELSLDALTTRR